MGTLVSRRYRLRHAILYNTLTERWSSTMHVVNRIPFSAGMDQFRTIALALKSLEREGLVECSVPGAIGPQEFKAFRVWRLKQ